MDAQDFKPFDMELYFVTEILKLDSLHYGYFLTSEEPTLESIREAQATYRETLIDLIPSGVKTILDVGSGIGDLSKTLVKNGYQVTALSPELSHKKFYTGYDIDFYNVTFEEFNTDKKFDLIIMSESAGYFALEFSLNKCKALLNNNGYFINSGLFRKKAATLTLPIKHVAEDYIAYAEKINLAKITEIDITTNILPSLAYCWNFYLNYFIPSCEMVKTYFTYRSSWKFKFFSLFFKKQINQLLKFKRYYDQRINPTLFQENAKYLRLIFQSKE